MLDSNRLLVIAHPVLSAIGSAEMDRAIKKSRRSGAFDYVEVAPLHTTLDEQYDLDWEAQRGAQERLFVEQVRPYLAGREQLAYFGLAPVPLAIHLGYRVQSTVKIDVYQRHHERENWVWMPNGKGTGRSFLAPVLLPPAGSSEAGPVVIRVSTSALIDPEDTKQLVPKCLLEVDIALASPDPDALETRGALDSVVDTFTQTLTRVRKLFPNLTEVHLFAAVPVGLAFRLGSRINTTMFPEVVTYQYDHKRSPRYRRAIVLGAPTRRAEENPLLLPISRRLLDDTTTEARARLKDPPPWRGRELIVGDQETFLDIWFLQAGLRVAKSVVHLLAYPHGGKPCCGTGFLIAPNTILTNHHVLYDHDDNDRRVQYVAILFNFENDPSGQPQEVDTYEGNVETIDGDKKHDWAIIRSKTPIHDAYPIVELVEPEPVRTKDPVFIIQHPAGRPKKIGLLHNWVVHVTQDRIQYLTDTLPGSSGSPVCNKLWQVVALHYLGIEDTSGKPEDRKNEGIHINRVVEGLRERGILPAPPAAMQPDTQI